MNESVNECVNFESIFIAGPVQRTDIRVEGTTHRHKKPIMAIVQISISHSSLAYSTLNYSVIHSLIQNSTIPPLP